MIKWAIVSYDYRRIKDPDPFAGFEVLMLCTEEDGIFRANEHMARLRDEECPPFCALKLIDLRTP